MKRKRRRPHTEMTTEELTRATAKFDEEFVIDQSREPTPQEKAHWRRAKRKPGRPRVGNGVQVISVSIERELLKRTDQLAKRLKVHRTKLIARGLRAILDHEVAIDK